MKKFLLFLFMTVICLSLTSCGGGDDVTSGGSGNSGSSGGSDTNGDNDSDDSDGSTTLSIDARPTDWVRTGTTADYVPGVSLTLTIAAPDLSAYKTPSIAQDDKGDLMAAFVNGTCRSADGAHLDGSYSLFYLSVVALTTDNADETKPVTIKYYSAKLHHIFTAKSSYVLKNQDEDPQGDRANPLKLEWEK